MAATVRGQEDLCWDSEEEEADTGGEQDRGVGTHWEWEEAESPFSGLGNEVVGRAIC